MILLKYLKIKVDTDLKIILLDHLNNYDELIINYIESSSMANNLSIQY